VSIPKKSFEPDAACPLDGIRVVDMSRLVAGNAVSSQLADFGAEVIKIEDPGKGDPLRAWQTGGVSLHWKLYARNKKSVALSLRPPRGRELLLDLISTAEVLIENFRPGTLEKMGLAPGELHKRNPRLVIVRVSGRWSRACRATPRAPASLTASRCCRRPLSLIWSRDSTARSP
jgi:crotonobetainyl-CoA:carnitine CoA-transferase CaiB-like acyl-CoA transferase